MEGIEAEMGYCLTNYRSDDRKRPCLLGGTASGQLADGLQDAHRPAYGIAMYQLMTIDMSRGGGSWTASIAAGKKVLGGSLSKFDHHNHLLLKPLATGSKDVRGGRGTPCTLALA